MICNKIKKNWFKYQFGGKGGGDFTKNFNHIVNYENWYYDK
jgi:hypothetical protein